MRHLRNLRRLLQGQPLAAGGLDLVAQRRGFDQARLLTYFFYLYMLYWFITVLVGYWPQWRMVAEIVPLWPIYWLGWTGIRAGLDFLAGFSLLFGVLAVIQPENRIWRLGVFACFFAWYAFVNSFGKISHDGHAWTVAALLLVFLPNGNHDAFARSPARRHAYLTIFWGIQFFVGLFYSMSGVWKIGIGLQQLFDGQLNTFHPHALANLVAFRMLQTNTETLLGWLVVEYPLLGWPLHLGGVYMELFSLVAVFRPQLHRLWGIGLVLFHIGTWLLMGIVFQTNIMLLGLFFIASPFALRPVVWSQVLVSLPLLGNVIRFAKTQQDRQRLAESK